MKPCVGQVWYYIIPSPFRESLSPRCRVGLRPAPRGRCGGEAKGTDHRRKRCRRTDLVSRSATWSLLLSSSRGSSFLSRFGFSRLFELSTHFSLPSAGISCASSQEFIQQGRAAHSFVRSRGSDRVSELHAAPKPKRQVNPTPDSSINDSSTSNYN